MNRDQSVPFKQLVLAILFVIFGAKAKAQSPVDLSEGFRETTVFPFEMLADPKGQLEFDRLPRSGGDWSVAPGPWLNLGYTDTSYWLKFRLAPQSPQLRKVFLEVSYPLHDRLELHIPDQTGRYSMRITGDNFPFDERPIKVTRFVFELDLAAIGRQPLFLNIRSGSSMRIAMKIYEGERLLERNQEETAGFFLFYGTMLAMMLFNSFLYFSIREPAYIYYVFYIFSHTLFQMSLNGHVLQFIMPDFPGLAASLIPTLVGTTSIGIARFTQEFLETREHAKRCHIALQICIGGGMLLILLNLFLPYATIIPLANLLPFYFSVICVASGIVRWGQAYRPARIYVAAFAAFFLGVVLAASLTFGILPSSFITEYGAQIGSTIEVIMLSLALASKINLERKIRYDAQKNVVKMAMEKQHSYEQMEKLLYPHQLKMIQSGQPLEMTMPTGIDMACVLSFDVMNSSKVKSEGFGEVMEEFIAECRDLMMQGYDGDLFISNAYMIKEMGDGFLCSVGFPLKQTGPSKAACALALAHQIIEKFSQVNHKLDAPSQVYCCVGIAMGPVRSYFSKSGSVKYDMWGHGIILATRYEALRKDIFRKLGVGPGHLLIVQEDVYYSLSSQDRVSFEVYDLESVGIQVRDHAEARKLVFKRIAEQTMLHDQAS